MDNTPSLADLKKIVGDCFTVKPWIYWLDFITSMVLGWSAFALAALSTNLIVESASLVVAGLALYRCTLFIHEISHQDRKDLPFFSIFYNLTVGIPVLVPTFMYRGVHLDHHRKTSYGTIDDGEYLPLGAGPRSKIFLYLAQCFTVPIVLFTRFAILNPLSLLHPKLRKLLMERGSALAIHFNAARKIPQGKDFRNWVALEILGTLYAWTIFAIFFLQVLSWTILAQLYALMVVVLFINSLRTVVAHRYRNGTLKEISFQDQLLDSINLEGNTIFHELVAPVGLRFHALHHLFPTIPYHSLGIAHRKLLQSLPQNSFYHQCSEPNLFVALDKLWQSSKEAEKALLESHRATSST